MDLTLDDVIADPPQVHADSPHGVWFTERSCYKFLEANVHAGSATLETGMGISTAIFAKAGCEHTAAFLEPAEGDRFLAWAAVREVPVDRLTFLPGGSDLVLPKLDPLPLDLVFIDGGHGFPLPQIDWFYAAARLRRGAVLVVDDINLAAPHDLAAFLDLDPRWDRLAGSYKWAAWRRLSEGPLSEEFTEQPFLPAHLPPWWWRTRVAITSRVPKRIKRATGRLPNS